MCDWMTEHCPLTCLPSYLEYKSLKAKNGVWFSSAAANQLPSHIGLLVGFQQIFVETREIEYCGLPWESILNLWHCCYGEMHPLSQTNLQMNFWNPTGSLVQDCQFCGNPELNTCAVLCNVGEAEKLLPIPRYSAWKKKNPLSTHTHKCSTGWIWGSHNKTLDFLDLIVYSIVFFFFYLLILGVYS